MSTRTSMSARNHSCGRKGLRSSGPAAALLAVLALAGCDGTANQPLAPDTGTTATFAANANSGALVNSAPNNVSGAVPDVSGTATAKCVNGGTQINVNVSGIRAGGLYTIWILTFNGVGAKTATGALGGQTPSGPNDGYRNVFTASASGQGQITRIMPAGPASVSGIDFPGCLLDVPEFHVAGFFHSDGKVWGAKPKGNPPMGTVDFGFIFD